MDNLRVMAPKQTEDTIRKYLDSLGSSSRPVVDREAVKSLKREIRSQSDPIKKLALITALEEEQAGRAPDLDGPKATFVAEGKAWAEGRGFSASALQTLGVPDEVLRQAGFSVSARTRPASSGRRSGGSRAPRVPFEEVTAAAKKLGKSWKLADLAAAVDRDSNTTRNYVKRLIHEGLVTEVGDDPSHDGRGRAPKLYTSK
jgi:hypothetical protein